MGGLLEGVSRAGSESRPWVAGKGSGDESGADEGWASLTAGWGVSAAAGGNDMGGGMSGVGAVAAGISAADGAASGSAARAASGASVAESWGMPGSVWAGSVLDSGARLGGLGMGFLAVSRVLLANSMTCP